MTAPHSSHSRFGSLSSNRQSSAAIVPRMGSTAPMKNHSTNELRFHQPIDPADRPQKKQRTSSSMASEDAQGPDDRDYREDHDDHRGDRRDDPDDDLEEDPGRDQQDQ